MNKQHQKEHMNKTPLRRLYPLEEQLHQEMIAKIDNMMVEEGITAETPPPPHLIALAMHTGATFEAIGFVMTSIGLMARIDDDILDHMTEDMGAIVQTGMLEVDTVMRLGPSVR